MEGVLTAILGILLLLLFTLSLGILLASESSVFATVLGFGLLVVGIAVSQKKCPEPKVEYRFVPRTFQEEQENPAMVSDLFDRMFTNQEPWIHAGQASSTIIGDRVI